MTIIDTTAVNTTNILSIPPPLSSSSLSLSPPPTTTTTTTTTTITTMDSSTKTAEILAENEAQIINNDSNDIPVPRKSGISSPVIPLTTGTIKSEIMKEIYCSGSLLETVQKANIFHDCKHFVDMPLKLIL
uniref:Uncharacterized protein n=1 Tax=Loa loa TaxID=7209 RepID=A0A1I7VBR9_LOALO